MISKKIISKQKPHGFTIVELLVVIVVIGILAAITIIAYTGITARANTASGQTAANNVMSKVNTYMVDGPTSKVPTTYGSLTNAATTTSYNLIGANFTTISSAASAASGAMTSAPSTANTIDFWLCGTGSAAAATTYGTVTVQTGIKVGYWDYGAGAVNTTIAVGATSGTYTNGYAITCYKAGIADSAIAVARAIYNESGTNTWPTTAAAINANTATTAKLPTGMTVGITAPTSGNGTNTVLFQCGTAVAATLPCNNTGGRIGFWDYTLGTPAVVYEVFGTATNFATPLS